MNTIIIIGEKAKTRKWKIERYRISDGIAQIAGAVIGGGMDMINSNQDRQFNKGQAREADARALENSKQLALFNKEQQLDLWNKTNYGAQMEHLKNAGLNPGLMYGMSGGGGATANLATGGGGQGTASKHQTPSMQGMGMQLGQAMMNAAQIENIKANTEKQKVEAEKIAGVDTEVGKATVTKLGQDVEQGMAETQFAKAKTAMQTMQNTEQLATQPERIEHIKSNAGIAAEQMEIAKNERKISDATYDEQIKIIEQEAINAVLKGELTAEETREISQKLAQGWEDLYQKDKGNRIQATRNKIMWELGKMNIDQRRAEMIADAATSVMRGAERGSERREDREWRQRESDRHQGNYERDKGW